MKQSLESVLKKITGVRVVPYDLNKEKKVFFDFTADNTELQNIDITDPRVFSAYLCGKMEKNNALIGIGKYNENRTIYNQTALFAGDEPGNAHNKTRPDETRLNKTRPDETRERRILHLGLDIWVPAGTAVLAALDGHVHSFQDNNNFGDYGPTIIVEHTIEEITFYTLYGHLERSSLQNVTKGMNIKKGQTIAAVGDIHENGQWPPHLHFEIIRDLQGQAGDFPGVCTVDESDRYLHICPDPNLLLKMVH